METSKKILVVEDEVKIANLLNDFLSASNFEVKMLHDGALVIEAIEELEPDFVILDVMLPNKDGLTLCKEIRTFSNVPIMMLTARVDEIDRLMGLGLGADDYVCKPFSVREVVARVNAILKRTQSLDTNTEELHYKGLVLDAQKYSCFVNQKAIELTPVEFRLLQTLLAKPGNVFSREKLMENSYTDSRIVSNRTIDSHMKNLRSKINQQLASEDELIHTIYGVGYKIE